MAERTLAQQLTDIDAAIEAIVTGGQSYSIAGRTYTRANLSELRAERNDILRRIEHETGHGRRRAEF